LVRKPNGKKPSEGPGYGWTTMKVMTENRLCKKEVDRSYSVEGSAQRACNEKKKDQIL